MMVWELHSAVQDEALAVTGNTAEIAMGGGGGRAFVTAEQNRVVTADHLSLSCDDGALGSS